MASDTEAGAAPIIVTAQLGPADQAWADNLRRRHFPPERNVLPAHVTLFHHLPPSIEPALRRMLAGVAAGPKPKAEIAGVRSLGRGVAIDLRSDALMAIRDEVAEAFADCLTPQDRHRPRLHITVQNKVSPEIARETLTQLRAQVAPRPVEIVALACWHYRGGPWSPIVRFAFRG